MARNRKDKKDNILPPRVSKNKYSYYLKTRENKTVTLGSINMSMVELWAKYDGVIAEQKEEMTFSKLWSMHLNSAAFHKLSSRSQEDKLRGAKKILPVFGHINVNNIKPEHIRRYMDIRGEQSKVQANHELSYMSVAFGWGYERGYCKMNPCAGIKKFSIQARDKYIEDIEYYTIYDEAIDILKVAMEISYLCAVREGDIFKLKHSQILKEGIYIKQGKTGKRQIKQWTERLADAINLAKKLFPPSSSDSLVLQNKSGGKLIQKTFNSYWLDAKRKAEEKLGRKINCTFHDIKAKAISDYDGATKDKQLFSGHKTEAQVNTYDRKVKVTPTLNPPKKEDLF